MAKGALRGETPAMSAVYAEARRVVEETVRWRALFDAAEEAELVEMCIYQLKALSLQHAYLRRRAGQGGRE